MEFFLKTTYLLAFLLLFLTPPTVKLSNPFFWHLTLSRLTLWHSHLLDDFFTFLSALCLDSLTVARKWRICLQFTVKPRFDTLWHFDSWRWNNMIYSEKTTYLLAFLPLLPAPPTVKLSNPFFWHLTLSRLTLDTFPFDTWQFDSLPFDSWHLINVIFVFIRTLPWQFDNLYFDTWHFDTLTVTKKIAEGRQRQHGCSESIHKNPLHFLFPYGIMNT